MGTPPVTSPPDRKPWLLLAVAMLLGGLVTWAGSALWSRELYIGIGPSNTSFRHIALAAAAQISNRLSGVHVVFCPNDGTEKALAALTLPRTRFVGWLLDRDCAHQDLVAVTDGVQLKAPPSPEEVGILVPLYKSYVQFFVRDGVGPQNLTDLLQQRSAIRFGVPPSDQATFSRACRLLYRLSKEQEQFCVDDNFDNFKFREVKSKPTSTLAELLLSRELDAISAGGPICPEGTETISTDPTLIPIGLENPVAEVEPAEKAVYPCAGKREVLTPYHWTYFLARRTIPLSNSELSKVLQGLDTLQNEFRRVTFAHFGAPADWLGIGETAKPFGLSYLSLATAYPAWLKDHPDLQSDFLGDFIAAHGRVVQFFGSLVAMVGGLLAIAKAIANRKNSA